MSNIGFVFHGFHRERESHKQDGETLAAPQRCIAFQRPAILPWPSNFPLSYERAIARSTGRQNCCRAKERALLALRHKTREASRT
jgi:hypothetical protein